MSIQTILPSPSISVTELRRLPTEQREAILAAAAEQAAIDYEQDPSLTQFEAFGEADLYGHSSDTQPG